MAITERVIEANDKPRAEVMVDVQILEVSRERAKQYGLDLSSYSAALAFLAGSRRRAPTAKPFNLNTISQGVSTADFYLSVPSAVVRFLESDSQTKVLAKPHLRGAEGQKLSLNLGEDVPVPSTTFTPLAAGGRRPNPLTSYGYRTIGIIVDMTPRVTYDGDIILELTLENSARGQDTQHRRAEPAVVLLAQGADQAAPARRRIEPAGRPAARRRAPVADGIPGPPADADRAAAVLRQRQHHQADRHRDAADAAHHPHARADARRISSPIYIGTQSNMSLTGPPATIGGGAAEPDPAAPQRRRAVTGTADDAGRRRRRPRAGAPPRAAAATQPAAAPVLPTGSARVRSCRRAVRRFRAWCRRRRRTGAAAEQRHRVSADTGAGRAGAAAPAAAAHRAAPRAARRLPAARRRRRPVAAPARITLSPPSEMRVGSGPYTIPISIAGATRVSTMTLSITYNPALVRIRNVQEGTFMRQGGIDAGVQQPDRRQERPHRHRHHAARRQDRRLDVGPARGAARRTARGRHRLAGG